MIERVVGAVISVFVVFFLLVLWLVIFEAFTWKSCKSTYADVQYSFWWGCKINYKWEYIPLKLYERAFEQNLNISSDATK